MSSDIMFDFMINPSTGPESEEPAKRRTQSVPMLSTSPFPSAANGDATPPPKRQDSMLDSMFTFEHGGSGASASATPSPRHHSIASESPATTPAASGMMRTRSLGMGPPVFDRSGMALSDDDIIIVTVKLTNKFRQNSVTGAEDLPGRPPRRSFLRRISTRVAPSFDHTAEKEERYKAVKMPRGEYKRQFLRDAYGKYKGTAPEREWDEEQLMEEYGQYQNITIQSKLGAGGI